MYKLVKQVHKPISADSMSHNVVASEGALKAKLALKGAPVASWMGSFGSFGALATACA